MDYDSVAGNLYCYSGSSGVVSVIDTSDNSFVNIDGFPITTPIREKTEIFHVNKQDGLVYLLSRENKKFIIWDEAVTGKIQELTWTTDDYEYFIYDDSIGYLVLIDKTHGRIARIK